MTKINADADTLKDLRHQILHFSRQQMDVIHSVEGQIRQTVQTLDEAHQRCMNETMHWKEELNACLGASQRGASVDCHPIARKLQMAQAKLNEVKEIRRKTERAVEEYNSARRRYDNILTHQIPDATAFLANCITALEASVEKSWVAIAPALLASGHPALTGLATGAIRRGVGALSRVGGALLEQIAAQVLKEKYKWTEMSFDQPHHGFDRVFHAPGAPLIIMESKLSQDGKLYLRQTKSGQQMSSGWINATATKMTDPDSAQWSPANEHIANLIQELEVENVLAVSVVINVNTGLADVFQRQGNANWQLIGGGISVKDY